MSLPTLRQLDHETTTLEIPRSFAFAPRIDDGYRAYGSNGRDFLHGSIARIANRSNSVLDMYRACANQLCEFAGAVATRLYLVRGCDLHLADGGCYFGPALSSDLRAILPTIGPTLTLGNLQSRLDEHPGAVGLRSFVAQTSPLGVRGVDSVFWGVIVGAQKIEAAIEFVHIDHRHLGRQDIDRIASIVAEFSPVLQRERWSRLQAELADSFSRPPANCMREPLFEVEDLVECVRGSSEAACDMLREDPGTGSALVANDSATTPQFELHVALQKISNQASHIRDILKAGRRELVTETIELAGVCDLALGRQQALLRGVTIERSYMHESLIRTEKATLVSLLQHLVLQAYKRILDQCEGDSFIEVTTSQPRPYAIQVCVRATWICETVGTAVGYIEDGSGAQKDPANAGLAGAVALATGLGGTLKASTLARGVELLIIIPTNQGGLA